MAAALSVAVDQRLSVERLDGLAAARPVWDALAERSRNVFATFEWADAWWRHLGAGRELVLGACRRHDGTVAALLPLVVARTRPLRLIRFVGYGPADQLGPVCGDSDRPVVAGALATLVAEQTAGGGLFLGERLGGDEGWPSLIGAPRVRLASSPVLAVDGRSFDELLAARSRNFREQVRRRERKLARETALSFRLTDGAAALERDFDTLVRLHDLRWGGRSGAFAGPLRDFHYDFAHCALERGWLRLWTMEVDGQPAAAWYGLRFAGIESYYQAGRDPAFDSRSAGFVLLAHTIRAAFEDGVDEYRFGLGAEPYKDRFAERDPGVETVALAGGVRGRAALAGVRAVPRLPAAVRRRLIGLGA